MRSWQREKRGKLVDIYKNSDCEAIELEPGRKRRLIHTDNLMVVVWDFTGGSWEHPDVPHSHPHEQVTFSHFPSSAATSDEKRLPALFDFRC